MGEVPLYRASNKQREDSPWTVSCCGSYFKEPTLQSPSCPSHHARGLDVIRKEAWSFYRTISGVRLCWELENPQAPKVMIWNFCRKSCFEQSILAG